MKFGIVEICEEWKSVHSVQCVIWTESHFRNLDDKH